MEAFYRNRLGCGRTYCSPCASDKREVQEIDGVRGTEPDFDSVIGSEVPNHDPLVLCDKPSLDLHPLITRRCDQAWSPEDLVQLDDTKPRDLAQTHGEGRLA